MSIFKGLSIALVGAAFLLVTACSTSSPTPTSTPVETVAPDDQEEMMDDEEMTDQEEMMEDTTDDMMGNELALVSGWYKEKQVQYYDFGTNSVVVSGNPATAPIYAFIHGMNADGSPNFVEGQHNVVNVVPGDSGYSDLWQVMLVTVPEGYTPDSITSLQELNNAGYDVTATDILVNCPIVPEGTTLEGGEPLTQGWYQGEEVYYPDFGPNSATAIPIWAFITGMDADGNPQFVEGQNNVIDLVPGDAGYSAFWQVNLVVVPEGYEANSIQSASGVFDSGYEVIVAGIVVNCPVTVVASG